MRKQLLYPLSVSLFLVGTCPALEIVINPTAALSANTAALAAFNRAADQWEAIFTDDVTVTVDADVSSFGPSQSNVIGSASSFILQNDYDIIVNQLKADADADDAILASLPTAAQFMATLTPGDSISANISANKANLKAMGFTGLDAIFGASDGTISFNSDFSFDYDNSDGVTAGFQDFETVAIHEIGHVLGFTSSVDTFDSSTDPVTNVAPRIFDLFRFDSTNAPSNAAEFTSFARELSPGTDAVFTDTSTSISLSTGRNEGDGQQASHFEDNLGLGVLDPTLAPGTVVPITSNDILVFDLIGWDYIASSPVPEPSSSLLLAIGAVSLTLRRRKR